MVFDYKIGSTDPLPPVLVVLHDPGEHPERARPGIRLLARRGLNVGCAEPVRQVPVVLSLLRAPAPL
jgi:hypothetical protein